MTVYLIPENFLIFKSKFLYYSYKSLSLQMCSLPMLLDLLLTPLTEHTLRQTVYELRQSLQLLYMLKSIQVILKHKNKLNLQRKLSMCACTIKRRPRIVTPHALPFWIFP